jgi:hypothetical protein
MRILIRLLLSFSFLWATANVRAGDSLVLAQQRIFPQHSFRAVYKTRIHFKDKDLSGLLLVRQNADSSFRVAMVTEVGMKIFEFKFFARKKDNFQVVSILSYMDRKIIINTLRRDFESLFMTFATYKNPHIRGNELCYRYGGRRIYQLNEGSITRMLRKKLLFKKEQIEIESEKGALPQKIFIRHYGVDLQIEMEWIK